MVEGGEKFNLEYLGGQGGGNDYDGEDLPMPKATAVHGASPVNKLWPCDYAIQYDHIE